jgi:hypothetical protein
MKRYWPLTLTGGLAVIALAALASGFDGIRPAVHDDVLSGPAFGSVLREAQAQVPGDPVDSGSGQPIAFPHDRHAAEFQIDCQYCHFSAERSMNAGIPPVATCMGCHTFVPGRQNPEEINRLREYWDAGEAIPWNRIYKVADHVQFPHMRHISAGVDCASCHGNVREIGVIQSVNQPLTMGWCINCHIASGASRDCTVCHY